MELQTYYNDKDRLFCFIFGREENKKWTLSLYNAVNGTDYSNLEDVEITTMGDVIYMGMKNDVSFLINSEISLYEHQSTYNPNMPVRQLMYLGRQYDKYIKRTKQNIYGYKQMTLPIPRLVVFYNGVNNKGDRILKLSDSFPKNEDPEKSDVEVRVHMYNIRPQYDSSLLADCKVLAEYSWFVEEIRSNRKTMDMVDAVDKAIRDMPEDFEIRKFLTEHQSEVKNMCLTEYDEAETMQMFKEEGREEGLKEGREEGREEGRKEGREEGREEQLVEMVCKKLKKGLTVSRIASDLEEDESHVQSVVTFAEKYAPDYDVRKIVDDILAPVNAN